ncbi:MAG: hypothetical protein KatS3mg060_0062 [Dehalococcoidia bacterium]|nr:MAG: hypothetical protein KatS3mg060_0062 [Dehalococcoidia bacterium]
MQERNPVRTLLQVLAAVDFTPRHDEPGEPLSYALWEMGAPATTDPDPRPRTLLRAYQLSSDSASRYLNATV